MRRTFKYRAKPNKSTEANALEWLYLCRTLYNTALEQRILLYQQNKHSVSKFEQNYQLPALKREFPEFKQVGSQVLQDVIARLDKAYQGFFSRVKRGETPGFPRFKSKHRYNSFTLSQAGYQLEPGKLTIRNVGVFKFKEHRPILGIIKTITIHLSSTGKWFICFSCDNVPPKTYPKTGKTIGIDVGLESFLTDSDGNKVDNPRWQRKALKALRRKQRRLSRRKKGSRRRNKARHQVALAHETIANQRLDFLHKLTTDLVKRFDTIYVENLNIQNMVKNHHLALSINDAGWGKFLELLTYKAEEAGKSVVQVNPRNTSQKCSGCGAIAKKSLAVRTHSCPQCGLVLDRDHNAAINIAQKGHILARCEPSRHNVVDCNERVLRSLSL
jgi:putative transposase